MCVWVCGCVCHHHIESTDKILPAIIGYSLLSFLLCPLTLVHISNLAVYWWGFEISPAICRGPKLLKSVLSTMGPEFQDISFVGVFQEYLQKWKWQPRTVDVTSRVWKEFMNPSSKSTIIRWGENRTRWCRLRIESIILRRCSYAALNVTCMLVSVRPWWSVAKIVIPRFGSCC